MLPLLREDGRKLMLESCRRSSGVNFHFWLWAASSTNVRCRALRAAWTISVSSKSLMLRRIGTWKLTARGGLVPNPIFAGHSYDCEGSELSVPSAALFAADHRWRWR